VTRPVTVNTSLAIAPGAPDRSSAMPSSPVDPRPAPAVPRSGVAAAPAPRVDDDFWALFTRADHGWTGGDTTNSILLPDGRTVWLFGDTFLGPVNPDRTRPATAPLIHNSLVVQDGRALTTIHGGSRTAPRALFTPRDGASWYWLNDGTVEGDALRLFLLKFLRDGPEGWAWHWTGTDLATLRLPDLTIERINPVPIANGIRYGAAILEEQDHTYVFGVEDLHHAKYAHVARARRDALLGPWEFFDGRSWSDAAAGSDRILDASVGTEFSVIALERGYALVTFDTANPLWEWREIVAYFSPQPVGPWGERTVLYVTPETGRGKRFVYNVHAHPQFGRAGEVLLSYNVNSFNVDDLYADADLYRARFVRVALPGALPAGE
jgi:hypothetical protein